MEMKGALVAFPVVPVDKIGWAFRKQDKDLQKYVEKFFEKQKTKKNSEVNLIWKKYFGMSLSQYIKLMTATAD